MLHIFVAISEGLEKRRAGSQYFLFAAVCLVLSSTGCKQNRPYSPTRPSNVASNATYIQSPDGLGVWNACEYVNAHDECHIWTVGGTVLEAGTFIPYDSGDAPAQSDLQIAQQGGSNVIKLQNGRYLIPASGSGHDAAVRYLDFMTGKTKSFDTKKASEN
jgi:hypothetical protein